jgi:ferredoxin/flavodoxin---NADP+ reductase
MSRELAVIGGSPAGLSVASLARRAGVEDVVVLLHDTPPTDLTSLDQYGIEFVDSIDRLLGGDGVIEIVTPGTNITARRVVVDLATSEAGAEAPWPLPPDVAHLFHRNLAFEAEDKDVLVVGRGDHAVLLATRLIEARARVVLALDGDTPAISMLGRQTLEKMERDQTATILWRSFPETVSAVAGFPMVGFGDRRTPDLQFDHVVMALPAKGAELPMPVEIDERHADSLFVITEDGNHAAPGIGVTPASAWTEVQRRHFPNRALPSAHPVIGVDAGRARELATTHYNATITSFDTAHNELWRIKLRPDREAIAHQAGQYCSIGLGYWEPRSDDSADDGLDSKRDKLIRRSYSISSPIFDPKGYLVDGAATDEIELYIVWVQPDGTRVPALTPRLALKNVGDRLYLGPKVAGRYTVERVTDPSSAVVFVATGTGEAPHNAMLVELLRKGHHGPILSVVSVRYLSDLAYQEEHRELELRYPNYHYLAVPTREPGHPKRYAQDLLAEGTFEEALGRSFVPEKCHVFLCGNPGMIGLPEIVDGEPVFPETVGMTQLLHERGFTVDQRNSPGNLHYEEYW